MVYFRDIKGLKSLKIEYRDLNFVCEFSEVEIDLKIAPIHLAAFIGK